jgi:hypothetical protein
VRLLDQDECNTRVSGSEQIEQSEGRVTANKQPRSDRSDEKLVYTTRTRHETTQRKTGKEREERERDGGDGRGSMKRVRWTRGEQGDNRLVKEGID